MDFHGLWRISMDHPWFSLDHPLILWYQWFHGPMVHQTDIHDSRLSYACSLECKAMRKHLGAKTGCHKAQHIYITKNGNVPQRKCKLGARWLYVAMIMHLFGIVGVDAPTFSPLLQKKKNTRMTLVGTSTLADAKTTLRRGPPTPLTIRKKHLFIISLGVLGWFGFLSECKGLSLSLHKRFSSLY